MLAVRCSVASFPRSRLGGFSSRLIQHKENVIPTGQRIVRARSSDEKSNDTLSTEVKEQLLKSGLTPDKAKEILDAWQEEVGHELTPEDMRKILVGRSTKTLVLVLFSALLDLGAAYGSFVAGSYMDIAAKEYGWIAIVGQAVAFILAGYYVTGALFDFFKLGAIAFATVSFNVNSAAFLYAVEGIASSSRGLNIADKALDAVNTVKVFQALNKMVNLLQQEGASAAASTDMLSDLGAYLTLDKAIRVYGFDAASYGLTDKEAAEIAQIFDKYDLNDDGVISKDEFKKLCAEFSPEIQTDAEVDTALSVIDTNKDGSIDFNEFVRYWLGKINEKSMA